MQDCVEAVLLPVSSKPWEKDSSSDVASGRCPAQKNRSVKRDLRNLTDILGRGSHFVPSPFEGIYVVHLNDRQYSSRFPYS